ncbi:MAG: orotate phosphoribosyltransferase [Gammaproteobacteria bacterium]|nr:orotate phosphoribosyltransferase [Gammaproteobacteria bacterium]
MGVDKQAFLKLMVQQEVLRFGDFQLKSGRRSPYFFNLGAVSDGTALAELGRFYASTIEALGCDFDMLFGPAYKGIPIAVATTLALADRGVTKGIAFNRKEAKDHGEGGVFVGAPVEGRVLLVDDVLTAGTAIREAASLVTEAGATLAGIVIALDRQEKLNGETTAVRRMEIDLGVPVASIATLKDVIEYLDLNQQPDKHPANLVASVRAYQDAYCVLS